MIEGEEGVGGVGYCTECLDQNKEHHATLRVFLHGLTFHPLTAKYTSFPLHIPPEEDPVDDRRLKAELAGSGPSTSEILTPPILYSTNISPVALGQ